MCCITTELITHSFRQKKKNEKLWTSNRRQPQRIEFVCVACKRAKFSASTKRNWSRWRGEKKIEDEHVAIIFWLFVPMGDNLVVIEQHTRECVHVSVPAIELERTTTCCRGTDLAFKLNFRWLWRIYSLLKREEEGFRLSFPSVFPFISKCEEQ